MTGASADALRFADQLRDAGVGGSGAVIRHLATASRPGTVLHRYAVTGAGGLPLAVIVKVHRDVVRPSGRPRLVPAADAPASRPGAGPAVLESAALGAFAEELARQPEPGLRAVPILATWPADDALALAVVSGTPLDRAIRAATLPRRDPRRVRELTAAFEGAGRWLRRFHDLPLERPARADGPTDLAPIVSALVEGVAPLLGAALRARVTETAARLRGALPERLPLGLAHGDFALRNVLADPGPSVVALDTRGRWRAPVYEDLASLLLSLRAGRLQSATAGRGVPAAALEAWERALLAGYLGTASAALDASGAGARDAAQGAVDLATGVRLFGILVLLDRWAAMLERRRARTGALARAAGWPGDALVDARQRAELLRLIAPDAPGRTARRGG